MTSGPRRPFPSLFGWGLAFVLLATTFSGVAYATPLPPGVKASRPCEGPSAIHLPLGRSVDAFTEAVYNLDFGSEQGRLSPWLTLRYADGLTLYVHLADIGQEALDAAGVIRDAIDGARVCDGGRVFPRRMNRSTTPRLWAAQQEAERIQDNYNAEFILGHAFPAVFTILTASATLGGPAVATKRQRLAAIAGAIVDVERRRGAVAAHGLAQDRQEVRLGLRQARFKVGDEARMVTGALKEQYYTLEREEHMREAWMQEGTAREYFRSCITKALELLDAGTSKAER